MEKVAAEPASQGFKFIAGAESALKAGQKCPSASRRRAHSGRLFRTPPTGHFKACPCGCWGNLPLGWCMRETEYF